MPSLDLPFANTTPDSEVINRAVAEQLAIVTKDDDFVRSFRLNGWLPRLLPVSTGNISNAELYRLLHRNLLAMVSVFETHRFVEISRQADPRMSFG